MKLWQELVSTAIVGTDRQKFEPSARDAGGLGRLLNALESAANETALLKNAAVLGLYLKSGFVAAVDPEALPEPAAAETRAPVSRLSEHHLAALLAGNHAPVVTEFFELAAAREQILPPPYLPEVLDAGGSKRELRPFILPVLGARGRWLAQHNDDWAWALIEENPREIWETGTRDERTAALAALRRQNPAEARETLAAGWSGEAAKDRAAFVEVLKTNLEKADEEFLEATLQTDKSADVRRAAFDLLLKIPGSKLVAALAARAAALLGFKPGGFLSKAKIELSFPENFESDEKGDALGDLQLYLDERSLGKKAVKLFKLLHSVPPRIWEERFGAEKQTLIDAAKQSDWHAALLGGWQSAALNFADEEWLIALLPHSRQNEYYQLCNRIEKGWTNLQIERLIAALLGVESKKGLDRNFTAMLFSRLKTRWSDDFTRKILGFLQSLADERDLQTVIGLILPILNSGQFVSAKHLDRFEERWFLRLIERLGELPGYHARSIEEFTAVTAFRREMHAAFQNEEKL